MMISRRDRLYSQYPEPVIGYELHPGKSEFSIIIPEATENLCTNPSLEGGVTTGYTAVGGSLTAVATWQAFGSYGSRMVPAVSTESGQYYGTISLTSGTTYTYSITMQGEAGKLYYIWFGTTGGALIGTKQSFRATGHKQRVWVTYTETSSTTRRFYLTRDAQYTDQNVFYADGLQVEAKDHPTTFCDGTLTGFVVGETPYLWTGTVGASTSTRSAQTRSGGREVNLFDLGIRVLAVIGLGMMPLVDQSLAIPGYGELPQGTGTQAREFSIVSEIDAEAGSRQMSAILSTIYDAVKPDLTIKDQPLILRYQQLDDDGDPCGESLDILCKYRNGLEGQNDNNHSRRVAIGFKQYVPYLKSTYDTGASLGWQSNVANANYILQRSTAGVWAEMAGGANAKVRAMVEGPDGSIYLGGDFTNLGDANGDYIVKWNPATGAYSSLGTGMNGIVYALAFGVDGSLYAGGDFTLAGGVANTVRIAKWDGSVWTPLGTGANAVVFALVFGKEGYLYVGGNFTNLSDANGDYISRWTGLGWLSMGTGMNGLVYALAVGADGAVYAGGNFTLAGGVANTSKIAKWSPNPIMLGWSALGLGFNDYVWAITVGKEGIVYAGGNFTASGSIAFNYVAQWNGSAWLPLLSGADYYVYSSYTDNENNIYFGGQFTSVGGITLPDGIAIWKGSIFVPLDVNTPGASIIYSILISKKTGILYVGFDTAGTAVSATVTVPNLGSSFSYPIVTYVGPGTLGQLKNYTTGKAIYFNLTLLAGETAVLNLDPINPSFVSSYRGDIFGTAILPGSQLKWFMQQGANNISSFIYGSTTAATAITIRWQDQYNSVDAAVWK